MAHRTIYTGWLIAAAGLFCLTPALADKGWIDVHFHIVGDKGEQGGFEQAALRTLELMDKNDMTRIVLMSPPRPFESFDIDELLPLQKQYPARIAVLGGGGTLNPVIQKYGHSNDVSAQVRKDFEALAETIIAKGAKGFGEIAAHHVSLNPGHGYESVPADHPLLLLLADIAARHDVPIDFHFDPVPEDVSTPAELGSPRNPTVLKQNLPGFERLLAHNRKTKIVWAHAGSDPVGFYTPALVRKLMEKHPNLYCSVRTTHRSNGAMVHPKLGINGKWIEVLKMFPDRFVLGTDSFVITPGYTGPDGPRVFAQKTQIQRDGANELLAYLDQALARKIGSENAIRLYKLGQ